MSALSKITNIKPYILLFGLASLSGAAMAHSEPDKARYVAETGTDLGRCDNPIRPCKSISYAVQQAKKGDHIRVAAGSYPVNGVDDLFNLTSDIVPVLAGFNRFDHFQSQSPDSNPTRLTGVPRKFVEQLRKKGFNVIADGKGIDSEKLNRQLKQLEQLEQRQVLVNCDGGSAAGFPCQNIDLVAHVPLQQFSSRPSSGNDIWGHVDLNSGNEYAIMGVRDGVAVFDLSNPEAPREVGTITGQNSTWRDIKVYQYFDDAVGEWQAYAYSTIDNATEGVSIIDLNNLPNSISLVRRDSSVSDAHNVYISNVDYTLNTQLDGTVARLQLIGANRYSGSFHSYSLDAPEQLSEMSNQSSFYGYTHDGASVTLNDGRVANGCVNATEQCTVFVDFNEKEMVLWDISDPTQTERLSVTTYTDVPPGAKYVHSGWVSDDKRFVFLHDEFDEANAGLNSTVRIFQIDNLQQPVQVGQWTGPTRAVDHNGFVRGNRYYMSNYERGLTILDISDPASPVEVGFFDTFPASNNASYNGAWGTYPFLPSGLILVSDINSGLYVLRENTRVSTQGQLGFTQSEVSFTRNQDVEIAVARSGAGSNNSSVEVSYQVISGNAEKDEDFVLADGQLQWAAGEVGEKSIALSILDDTTGMQPDEEFFIRLFDPRNGATLGDISYLKVMLDGAPRAGKLEFTNAELSVAESVGTVTISVNRVGGSYGQLEVDYQSQGITAVMGVDFEEVQGRLTWTDGDLASKQISVPIIDDSEDEDREIFRVALQPVNNSEVGQNAVIDVYVQDDDSNNAPELQSLSNFEVNTRQTVSLSAVASDFEQDPLTYQWVQTQGDSVTLTAPNSASTTFVAPDNGGSLTFTVTVTDVHGASDTESVVVQVINGYSSSSGSVPVWGALILMVMAFKRSRRTHL
ncbi:choice-of-anchor B family protein [Pleionea litopenaei]|uniref:Choice-of-anchor B family protein n=1 Tax=Pleionea litopenaei TaxID=3070815 RepID=A0AA51RV58_9GAMM|nr:choice-of-anchor B family protein [Pleionea sp. HL-JVS1]WMS88311.1 choice-of-anchor B family protein [Pleionea sp. HL-JVS1]